MDDTSIALLAVAATLIVGLTSLIGVLLRRNSNNNRRLYANPNDPDKVPLGDVTVGWWEKKMKGYTKEIVEAIESLRGEK